MTASERLDGNGVRYRLNDQADLARVLLGLHNAQKRRAMGERGARRMAEQFSWESIARRRIGDYEAALRSNRPRAQEHATKNPIAQQTKSHVSIYDRQID